MRRCPALVGRDGFPLTWQHYQYGLAHIGRDDLRRQLWLAQGVRMGSVTQEDWEVYQRDMTMLTEVPKYG